MLAVQIILGVVLAALGGALLWIVESASSKNPSRDSVMYTMSPLFVFVGVAGFFIGPLMAITGVIEVFR